MYRSQDEINKIIVNQLFNILKENNMQINKDFEELFNDYNKDKDSYDKLNKALKSLREAEIPKEILEEEKLFRPKVVRVKRSRDCVKCSKKIRVGETALSSCKSLDSYDRVWFCPSCALEVLEYISEVDESDCEDVDVEDF